MVLGNYSFHSSHLILPAILQNLTSEDMKVQSNNKVKPTQLESGFESTVPARKCLHLLSSALPSGCNV